VRQPQLPLWESRGRSLDRGRWRSLRELRLAQIKAATAVAALHNGFRSRFGEVLECGSRSCRSGRVEAAASTEGGGAPGASCGSRKSKRRLRSPHSITDPDRDPMRFRSAAAAAAALGESRPQPRPRAVALQINAPWRP